MVRVQATTLIARPADRVFDFIAVDFYRNYRRWSPEVISLRPVSAGPVGLGSTARQIRVDLGRRTESTFRVTAFETGRRVEFAGISSPYRVTYDLDTVAGKTRLTFTFELSRLDLHMRPFEKIIRATAQDSAGRVVRNIRSLIETETPADPTQ